MTTANPCRTRRERQLNIEGLQKDAEQLRYRADVILNGNNLAEAEEQAQPFKDKAHRINWALKELSKHINFTTGEYRQPIDGEAGE